MALGRLMPTSTILLSLSSSLITPCKIELSNGSLNFFAMDLVSSCYDSFSLTTCMSAMAGLGPLIETGDFVPEVGILGCFLGLFLSIAE